MPSSPRSLLVNYGGTNIGISSRRQIHDKFSIEIGPRSFALEFQLLIAEATDALYETAVQDMGDVVREPFQDLHVTFNGNVLYDFRQSLRRAFNVRGQFSKSSDAMSTRLAGIYTIRFEGDLAADRTDGQPGAAVGWREATVQTQFDSSRIRQVTIAGEWTATPAPSQGARTAYENATTGFAPYALDVLTAIDSGATWRLIDEDYNLDDHDFNNESQGTVLRFQLTYAEVIFPHAGTALSAGVESGAVVRQNLRVSRDRANVASSPGTRRLMTATATYEAWIDRTVVAGAQGGSDVTGGGLEFLWDGTIRAHVLNAIRGSGILQGAIAVISENPNFDFDANRITAVVVAQGRGGPVIERRITIENHEVGGLTAVPVWDGGLRSRYEYPSRIDHQRVINETSQFLLSVDRELGLNRRLGEAFVGGKVIEAHSTSTQLKFGSVEGGGALSVLEVTGRLVIQVFTKTDGSRLSNQVAGGDEAPVFLFDFNKGILDFAGGGGGFGQAGVGIPQIQQRSIGNI